MSETGPDRLLVTALTTRGAVRDHNEDAITIGAFATGGEETAEPLAFEHGLGAPLVVAVCDGLGGHAAGEVASGYAARRLAELGAGDGSPDAVDALLRAVHAELTAQGRAEPALAGMATTVAGVLFTAGGAVCFNVGDSRVYKEDGGCLGLQSTDDSPPGDGDGPTSIVTQTLGDGGPVQPHLRVDPQGGAGRWLVCSDGLTDLVPLPEIEAVLRRGGDDLHAARELHDAAMAAGGRDNITVVLVRRVPAASVGTASA